MQSAQCGDTDLLRDELTVVAGVQTSPIEIVLRDDGATVSGRVDVGQGVRPDSGRLGSRSRSRQPSEDSDRK